MIRVLLCINIASEYDRSLLRGLARYSKEHDNCLLLSRMPTYLRERSEQGVRVAQWAKDWRADAIIGRWDYKSTIALSGLKIPVVLQNLHNRIPGFSTITGDYLGTGKLAAEFFTKKRFRNFAFFGIKDVIWSEERMQGFKDTIDMENCTFSAYNMTTNEKSEGESIRSWLRSLPKPVALFVCDDEHALSVSELCRIEHIGIPGDVALIGVDNDELLCSIADPPLSSITLDVERGGYETGRLLHESISHGSGRTFTVTIKPGVIAQRGSTKKHDISDPIVASVLEYIEDNFTQDINSTMIFSQVPLSRRAVEMRFKKATGTSTYKYLVNLRIDNFSTLLTTTDLPIGECATRSGIFDSNYLFRVFKKIKGCSPMEYKLREKK